MSIWRELLAAIDRRLAVREDGPIVAAEREYGRRLSADPGPLPLAWSGSMFVPRVNEVGGLATGTFYGRPFEILFPDGPPPDGHEWGLAVWTARRSGTFSPEVRGACRTCSDRTGWTVGPLGCATQAEIERFEGPGR